MTEQLPRPRDPLTKTDRVLRVLTPYKGPDPNPTVSMLIASFPSAIVPVHFSWGRAYRGHYDVMHVHWPDHLMKDLVWVRRQAKRLALIGLTVANRIRGIPMVWTVHNERPHDGARGLELLALVLWQRLASARVYMYNSALPKNAKPRDVVIKRGDYRPLYGDFPESPRPGEGLLTFGLIRPYKGIESLIGAIAAMEVGTRPPVLIAGKPRDEGYAESLREMASHLSTVDFDFRSLPDHDLSTLIQASALVVLPYRYMYNSGAALLALTLRRPILVPASPTMLELQREVGGQWVQTYSGDLGPEVIDHARREIASIGPLDRPDLSERDWSAVGDRYASLYRSLVR